jgi:hypothetical protein
VGVNEDKTQPESYDQRFKSSCPQIYAHITYIGFRMHEDPDHEHKDDEQEEYFRFKFISYIAYLMISLYYHYYYTKMIKTIKEEKEFKEADFAKLFEFTNEHEDKRAVAERAGGVGGTPDIKTSKLDEAEVSSLPFPTNEAAATQKDQSLEIKHLQELDETPQGQ